MFVGKRMRELLLLSPTFPLLNAGIETLGNVDMTGFLRVKNFNFFIKNPLLR
jgi:hypothetical protein